MIPLLFFRPAKGSLSEWKPNPHSTLQGLLPALSFPQSIAASLSHTCGSELLGALALLFPQGATWLAPPGCGLGIALTVGLLWTSEKTSWRQPASSSLLPHLLWFFFPLHLSPCITFTFYLHYMYYILYFVYVYVYKLLIACLFLWEYKFHEGKDLFFP